MYLCYNNKTIMRLSVCFIFPLCLFFFILLESKAQEPFGDRYNISYVGMEEGLLHNFIDDIYKDSRGFLWISTAGGGLSRYDGYEFVHYNINSPGVKLKSNFIKGCCEDDFGRLWIISGKGIDILDLFTRQLIIPETLASITNHPAMNILKDSQGNMWIYGASCLRKIGFNEKGAVSSIHTFSDIPSSVKEIAMFDIDSDGHIWAGIGNKVCKIYTTDEQKTEPVLVDSLLIFETDVRTLCVKENEVWIGTESGLIRYDKNTKIIKRYWYVGDNPRSITQNHISALAITAEKQLLISTLRGLNIYNPITDDFDRIMRDQGRYLNSDFINCMLVDGDIIWIGTETGGLNKITPRRLSLFNFIHNKENPNSLSPHPVNAIYEDKKGNLWVGTVEGGFNKKSAGSNGFKHYTTDNAGLSHNSVSFIVADPENQLWVGTWGTGVSIYDIEHPELYPKKYLAAWTPPGYPINFIGSLCYDSINHFMWIGTNLGFYFYDYKTDRIYSPFSDENRANTIHSSPGAIIDRYGQLWMGCHDGVYVFDLHSRQDNKFRFVHLKYKLDDPASQLDERNGCFFLDSSGVLWIGSNGSGIYKHIPKEDGSVGEFVGYTTEHGLINNNVYGIIEDQWKRLWISTNNGLSCFDPQSEKFINYTKEDGLPGNRFYWNASCRSANGQLYFGTVEGLTRIDPTRTDNGLTPVQVTLTKLRVMNEEILPGKAYIDTDISGANTLYLHESDKSFSLEFSALNYDSPVTAVYSYRLQGFDDHWINVSGTRRFANYTNLPAGKYTFQVKYSIDGITENSPITELSVVVKPFFYKTPWFISLMVIIIGCGVLYIYFQRIRTLQKQKELLSKKVEERTSALKEQKQLLEKQKEELSEQNGMLVQQNEKITRQKTQLIQMSKKVQELTTDKISFFTGITHEFRTPITLIIGPIERALKLSHNPLVIEQLHFVERNSKYLLSLVNQLMDFRKVESGKMEIVKTQGDFPKFISSILLPFEVFAADRKIEIRRYTRLKRNEFLFDPDALQKVITNLMSNAIKFTPDNGCVSIYAAALNDKENGERLYLCVKDTGSGIPEEDLNKIFNRFYQSPNHLKYPIAGQSGTGIGLYLCKNIVRMYGGNITAGNNRKAGSKFRILLPLETAEQPEQTPKVEIPAVINEDKPLFSRFIPGKLTLLIVEDNADMRGYIRSILMEHYNILEAPNGEEALSLLNQCSIDFIISDLMMPVMDGITLSQKVKENFAFSHIPFLMLTAKTASESRIESYKMGVDAYLSKPFNEELLLARINNILENRKRSHNMFANNMDARELQIEEESNDRKFINKALEIIHKNYKNSHYESVDFIEAMGISKSLLNNKLQLLIGQSIGRFIRNYRLNAARELIEKNKHTGKMNISEIAYEVGFNDPKYFTRCFTKRFNITPSNLMNNKEDKNESEVANKN